MQKALLTCMILFGLNSALFGQGDTRIPSIEHFEKSEAWPWAPWIRANEGRALPTATAAHSGKAGLKISEDVLVYRSDLVLGNPGQVLSWWFRFENPTHVYCGLGDSGISGIYLSADAGFKTLRFSRTPDYTYPPLKTVNQTFQMNTWYRAEIVFNSPTNITGNLYSTNGKTLINSITLEMPDLKPDGIVFRGHRNVSIDGIKGGDLLPETTTAPLTPKVGEKIILKNILFENDKSILLPQSYPELDRLVIYLKQNPTRKIEISGHTDNTGNKGHNQKLSEARAQSVATYLADHGISKNNITYAGLGSSKPIATNDTEDGRNKNRRVEFLLK
jgi:outer membrane protein OmpA-like peptidoglycan-associated protein